MIDSGTYSSLSSTQRPPKHPDMMGSLPARKGTFPGNSGVAQSHGRQNPPLSPTVAQLHPSVTTPQSEQNSLPVVSTQEQQPAQKDHPLSSSGQQPIAPLRRSHRRWGSDPSSMKEKGRTENDKLSQLTTSLEDLKEKNGKFHPQVGLGYNLIGNYHFRRGDLSAAAKSYNFALQCFEECDVIGTRSSDESKITNTKQQLDIAVALGNIGAVLWRTGRLEEAITSLEKCLKIRERVYATKGKSSKDSVEMANTLYSLGIAKTLHCDPEGAMKALDHARHTLLDVHGHSHIEVARIEDAQGKCLLMQGNSKEALEYHCTALKKKVDILGSEHTSVLSTKMNIASAHQIRNELDEAAAMYREVLSAQKLSLYRELDKTARVQVTSDIGVTLLKIGEIQKEKSRLATGTESIIEEKKESGY